MDKVSRAGAVKHSYSAPACPPCQLQIKQLEKIFVNLVLRHAVFVDPNSFLA